MCIYNSIDTPSFVVVGEFKILQIEEQGSISVRATSFPALTLAILHYFTVFARHGRVVSSHNELIFL
jgi:hypothetical protein